MLNNYFFDTYFLRKFFFDSKFPFKKNYEDDLNTSIDGVFGLNNNVVKLYNVFFKAAGFVFLVMYLFNSYMNNFHYMYYMFILVVFLIAYNKNEREQVNKDYYGSIVNDIYTVVYLFTIFNLYYALLHVHKLSLLFVLPVFTILLLVAIKFFNNAKFYPLYDMMNFSFFQKKGFFNLFEKIELNNNKVLIPLNVIHERFVVKLKYFLVFFMTFYAMYFFVLFFKYTAVKFDLSLFKFFIGVLNMVDNPELLQSYFSLGMIEFEFVKFPFINVFGKLVISPIFGIDIISLLFMGLTMILVFLCIFFLWPTFSYDKNIVLYVSQLLLLLTQLNITFTTVDILTFFIAFESLLIPMIIMIAFWGSKNNRQANNYLIFYTMVSAIPMLFAILFLINKTGTTNLFLLMNRIHYLNFMEQSMVWLAFFFAFAVKTPMVPFHIWLPKTHVDAPTVGSVILAGILLKVGLIGMIRFLFPLLPEVTHFFAPYVTAVATVGVMYASFITLRQIDMKRIIAYSSVAHMNMAMVSLCSLNIVGFYSTIYLMVSHGLIAGGLFFLVGFLYNRFHVRSVYYYSGLAMCMPILTVFFFLFTLANMAFPLTSGFIGEFLLLLGITINNFYLALLNSVNMLLTTVYSVLLFGRVFLGELKIWLEKIVFNYIWTKHTNKDDNRKLDLYPYEIMISIVLFVGIFILGIYPQALFNYLDNNLPIVQMLYTQPYFVK